MKILYFSDLHLEFPQQMSGKTLPPIPDDFDVVVAAGDIGYGETSIRRLEKFFPNKPVIFVPGNHEYYKDNYGRLVKAYADMDTPVHILNPGQVWIDGVHFVGATLWSDLKLQGYDDLSPGYVSQAINDFHLIQDFDAFEMVAIHQRERLYLEANITPNSVVVTHFVPTQECVHPRWVGQSLNPYFTNDMDYLRPYPLHIFGHTHDPHDIEVDGTRYVCNPRGYPGENGPFEWKIIDLDI